MREFARRHPLLTFVSLTYAVSWAYWIPLAIRGELIVPGGSITHFPGLLGPAIGAYLTTMLVGGTEGTRQLRRRLWFVSSPRGRFWIYALSPVAFFVLAVAVAQALGVMPPRSDLWLFSGLPPLPLITVLALVLLFNGFGEEAGWRGFALPLLTKRFGFLGGALVLAVIWAGWHVPTFWTIDGYRSMSVPVLIGGFGLGICAGSIVLARVAERTSGSILAAALWHLTYNMGAATAGSRGVIGMITTTCVEIWAVVIVIQEVRQRRATKAAAFAT